MALGNPNRQDRRNCRRIAVSIPLQLLNEHRGVRLSARTLDVSTTGALLHCGAPLRVGDSVRVEVSRGALRNPLALNAEIVRLAAPTATRRHHGVAVRFTNLSPIDAKVLESIIAGPAVDGRLGA